MANQERGFTVQTSVVYVCNLPPGTDEMRLAEHFGKIGLLKTDKRSGRPKIWIYRDKSTNEPKGDATVTYEDPHAAIAAVEWFNNTDFHGSTINVSIAETKSKEPTEQPVVDAVCVQEDSSANPPLADDYDTGGVLDNDGTGGGRGRGRGEAGGKTWQQEGDWPCPNPSCANINFAFRGVCNRCGAARPAGGGIGGGGMGGGHGRGRGASDMSAGRGRGPGGPPGLFGPNDWNCPMCGNINWAKRSKCNICNTTKPGISEGGVREGRAGGYKEFDEAEIEETKRRRRELEEDDGEMYDEFGNLKKKFRTKAKQGESWVQNQQTAPGMGKAGWDTEELGVVEKEKRDKGKDRGREYLADIDGSWDRSQDGDGYNGSQFSRDDAQGYEHEKDRVRERGRERDRYGDRGRSIDFARGNFERGKSRDQQWDREQSRPRDRERDRDRDRERGYDHNDEDRNRFREKERSRTR
ncbi:hypothetical protein O6H91_04G142100 [Diphasiastrum complanatum]|uniref:Uncharacterized protein n=1 Tax=Diphasiastrum complanatum TaxID=34168 RepID=A0ACC2E2L2_DIPCM|nr:hypothetical protein O6H91_04G142100 [Diphasiastrum complanatum]